MPKLRTIELRFPVAGVNRRLGFHDSIQRRPPFPTPWAVNVRATGPFASRHRGGSRPGLTEYTPDAIPDGELTNESSVALTTEAGVEILADTGTMPSSYFSASIRQRIYAITTTEIVSLHGTTGVVEQLEATVGSVPSGCTFGCFYRDRLIVTGGDNAILASRQGDPTDWDYGVDAEDAGGATIFQLAEASEVGPAPTPTALIPFKDSYLLAASVTSLWVLQGDPLTGGLKNIREDVGIVGETAWTRVGDEIVFLAKDGVWQVGADGKGLKCLTEEEIPEELRNLDLSTTTVMLGYSPEERGVYIFLTPDAGGGQHWFFDLNFKGFWPDVYDSDHEPVELSKAGNELLLTGADDTVRIIGGDDDDGTDIESHVLIGPIRPGERGAYGRMASLRGSLSEDSGAVTWRLVAGDTAEEACENGKLAIEAFQDGDMTTANTYVSASGSLTAGRNGIVYPRIRAAWFVVWLQSTAKWSYETMILETGQSGKVR